MNNFLKLCFCLLLILFTSCSSKQETLKSNLKDIVESAEKNYQNFSEKDWKDADIKFDAISKEFEENRSSYTPLQIKEVNDIIGRYRAIKVKSGINEFKNGLNDFIDQTKSLIKNLTSDSIQTK